MISSPSVSHRSRHGASPDMLAPTLLGSLATTATDTAVLRLFRQLMADTAHLEATDRPDPELDAARNDLRSLAGRIRAEPSTCRADLAVKVLVAAWEGRLTIEAGLIAECEAVVEAALD